MSSSFTLIHLYTAFKICLDKDAEVRAQLKFYSNWKKNDAINVLKGEKNNPWPFNTPKDVRLPPNGGRVLITHQVISIPTAPPPTMQLIRIVFLYFSKSVAHITWLLVFVLLTFTWRSVEKILLNLQCIICVALLYLNKPMSRRQDLTAL